MSFEEDVEAAAERHTAARSAEEAAKLAATEALTRMQRMVVEELRPAAEFLRSRKWPTVYWFEDRPPGDFHADNSIPNENGPAGSGWYLTGHVLTTDARIRPGRIRTAPASRSFFDRRAWKAVERAAPYAFPSPARRGTSGYQYLECSGERSVAIRASREDRPEIQYAVDRDGEHWADLGQWLRDEVARLVAS